MSVLKTFVALAGAVRLTASAPHHAHGWPACPPEQLSIHTSSGTANGIVDPLFPHVRQFLGVPFAQPPVGSLRWEPPQALPRSASSNTINATVLPPSCPQYLSTSGASVYTHDVLEFNLQGLNRTGQWSEDCLTASVWTPTLNETKGVPRGKGQLLPVLIYIYGGAFVNGGQNVPYQIPTQWIERTQDHIVVSFNYRVNIFGFPNAAGLDDQNLGIMDQRLAVEWIQQNIKAFGGDPERLTLWGQSAGAMSVDFYNYAYYENPIVKGLIEDSGDAFLPIRSFDTSHSNFSFVASKVGCAGLAANASAQLSCMRNVNASTIETFLQQYNDNGTTPAVSFVPIADEKIIFSNYTARALSGKLSKLPAILGNNAQDGEAFAPYNLVNPRQGPNQTLAEAALLSTFVCPTTETVRLRTSQNQTVYRYLYSGNFSNIATEPWLGAYHSAELPLIFGTFDNFRGQGPALENATSVAMQDAWVAFAKNGGQGLESTGWNSYMLGQGDVREFGAGVPVQDASLATLEGMCNGALPAS